MNNENNPVVLCEEDYNLLKQMVTVSGDKATDKMSLAHEVSRAIIVKNDAFPPNTIRLGSKVMIEDIDTGKTHAFTIVMPGKAVLNEKKISVLTPMAAAIIGFREGDEVEWQMPSGLKKLKVKEVVNSNSIQQEADL